MAKSSTGTVYSFGFKVCRDIFEFAAINLELGVLCWIDERPAFIVYSAAYRANVSPEELEIDVLLDVLAPLFVLVQRCKVNLRRQRGCALLPVQSGEALRLSCCIDRLLRHLDAHLAIDDATVRLCAWRAAHGINVNRCLPANE